MPIYEYQCRACHRRFDRFVRPTTASPDVPSCPHCQSEDLERLLSTFAVNSEATQRVHLQQARKVGAREAFEKKHAEIEQMRHIEAQHDHDH